MKLLRAAGELFPLGAKREQKSSGKSFFGVLEYNTRTDRLRCHVCGQWQRHLASHIYHHHHLSAREYKTRHGLNLSTALIGERTRRLKSQSSIERIWNRPEIMAQIRSAARHSGPPRGIRSELRNRREICPEQLMDRLMEIADENGGRLPLKEMYGRKIYRATVFRAFNLRDMRSVRTLVSVAREDGPTGKKLLVEAVRDFYARYGDLPRNSDSGRSFLYSFDLLRSRFGTVGAAFRAAGFEVPR